MYLTKDDYIAWRGHPATEKFQEAVLKELDLTIGELINTAGLNSLTDSERRGKIAGLKWLLEWIPDFIEESDDDANSEGTQSFS